MEDESASSVAADDFQEADNRDPASAESISTPKLGGPSKADASPNESDEVDASWGSPPEPSSPSVSAVNKSTGPASLDLGAKGSSPRNSSEEGTTSSYDVVSAGDVSSPKTEKVPIKEKDEDDSDSDWE